MHDERSNRVFCVMTRDVYIYIYKKYSPSYYKYTEIHTLTAIKLRPLSVARALAIIVLLQPGGPYNKTPLGGSMLTSVKAYLFVRVPS